MHDLRIREFRKKAGMSQRQLAEATGIEQSCVSRIERGLQGVTLAQLAKISEALQVSIPRLIGLSKR